MSVINFSLARADRLIADASACGKRAKACFDDDGPQSAEGLAYVREAFRLSRLARRALEAARND